MQDNKQGLQANPEYTIHYLSQEIMRLTQENAMLKAYIAKKIAETLNLLYQLTNKKQRVKVVKEVVERSDLSPEVTVKTQEQVNIKLDKTLDAIQKEREIDEKNKKENDKNIRDMKMWVLGLVGTIFGSLIIALLRMLMGI